MDEELIRRMDALLVLAEERRINFIDLGDLLLERYYAIHPVKEFSSGEFYWKAKKFFEEEKANFYDTCFSGKKLERSIDFLVICYESMYERKDRETFAERRNRERHELVSILGLKIKTVETLQNALLRSIEIRCSSLYPEEFKKIERLPFSKRRVAAEELLVNKIIES